jgi:hypothetical protein
MTEPAEHVPAALSAMLERDRATRARLIASGTLFDGYAPEMEAVHAENARALESILDAHGWPGMSLAGRDGSIAAWTVALHAIGMPAFQRRCLALLARAAEEGEVPPAFVAMMEDRIRFNERRPQRYGTIFDWDEHGRMAPWTIEDPAGVDARRVAVGLRPMEDEIRKVRRAPREKGDAPPKDPAARQRAIDAWARRTGWITDGGGDPGTRPGRDVQATGPS